jgi:hypothetical protein
VVDFDSGVAMVVTDLHGDGEAYYHLRDTFLKLRTTGQVDRLVICGDLIHGYGPETDDASLEMLLDVMRLQDELGSDAVTMLLGNHEMPHIYSVTLSKGHHQFTPRFEYALTCLDKSQDVSATRADVVEFLKSLPFYARTRAGVLLCHAGATPVITTPETTARVLDFDHESLLRFGDDQLKEYDLAALRQNTEYRFQAKVQLAVDEIDDPRYTDLLRGMHINRNHPDFALLWETLFTMNEMETSVELYEALVESFLRQISALSEHEQRVLVAGHIGVKGGYKFVGERHLRLASYAHAHPPAGGHYLLLNCEKQVETASQLVPHLHRIYSR